MRNFHILLLAVLFSISAVSQEKLVQFPDDFFGIYTGMLQISSDKGNQILPMEFQLLATDTAGKYTYTLVYGEGETKQIRYYSLLEKNKATGAYVVDENNGIILDDKVQDNRMYAVFEVNDTLLTTFITFEADHMIFEIIATSKNDKRVTYTEDEDKIEVISYPISTIQRAVLKKL
ncbi:hypothetical protein [Rasiella sp. SM2506]|uniref:hypothetical protein n=1 Tax=Rasiella sp. SM2506 TaxID=3423914 RepID=UPI003D79D6B8